ncbi:SpoIIE family protein phosphatase [Streptomyces collinus]
MPGCIQAVAGDVVGHDLETAVGMARLRNMLHS